MIVDLLPENIEAIEARLRQLGWINPDESLRALEPAGPGNMNRTLRARLQKRTLVLKQSIPFVAKYPSIAAPAERITVEFAFYRATRATPALSRRLPSVLGFDADNCLMALEDLGSSADFTNAYAQSTVKAAASASIASEHTAALVDWISALHALRIEATQFPELANRAMRTLNHAHIFDIPLRRDNGLDLDDVTPGLAAAARTCSRDTALRQRAAALGEMYLGNAPHASTPSLLHGDYYPGSWLRHARTGVAIIDPEFAFIGPPEFDIGVLIAHFTFAGFAQAETESVLGGYRAPSDFSFSLARAFAGIELIRRLLGVAQLPLSSDLTTKTRWLDIARQWMISA